MNRQQGLRGFMPGVASDWDGGLKPLVSGGTALPLFAETYSQGLSGSPLLKYTDY